MEPEWDMEARCRDGDMALSGRPGGCWVHLRHQGCCREPSFPTCHRMWPFCCEDISIHTAFSNPWTGMEFSAHLSQNMPNATSAPTPGRDAYTSSGWGDKGPLSLLEVGGQGGPPGPPPSNKKGWLGTNPDTTKARQSVSPAVLLVTSVT